MKTRKYTKEQFVEAIASSTSIAQALTKLNVAPHGGNYATVRKYLKNLKLDTSHMTRQGWNKGKVFGPKRPIEDYLLNKRETTSYAIKNRLLKEGYLCKFCYNCGRTKWMNGPIPLELDHINGKRLNNNLSNLRLLCPNCHALTSTYRGKNQKRAIENRLNPKKAKEARKLKRMIEKCIDCNTSIDINSTRCNPCRGRTQLKIEWPMTKILIQMVADSNYCVVARAIGVSDNAIRKRIANHPN